MIYYIVETKKGIYVMELLKCSDCGNTFEKRYVYVDEEGNCICKYCYEGNYETNDEGVFVENVFEIM